MRSKLTGMLLVGLVVLGACTPVADLQTTTSTSTPGTTTRDQPSPPVTTDPALLEELPVDPDVLVGTLDNGLTYYIRHNDSPGGRAELRLLVDAGSLLEDEDQAGMAHFLEHMMFNGTERFPRNELTAVLERFGPRFGPDINAYTSFDETVYELSLSAEDPELLELGINVLREWMTRATLTESDVVAERGVVLDEWRLRDQGFGGRLGDVVQDLLLEGTPYEGHSPIGTADSIRTTTPDRLRRFYEDWYHPELLAVVAVGDFDVEDMEERIASVFGDVEPAPAPRSRDDGTYVAPNEIRIASFADAEATSASIDVLWPSPVGSWNNVGALQAAAAHEIALEMVATRLNDDALRGDLPLLGASSSSVSMTRTIELWGINVEVRPDDLAAAVGSVFTELARVREHGFNDTEYARALDGALALSEQRHEAQETAQDQTLAGAIVAHHLAGTPLMSADQRFALESDVFDRLTKNDVEAAFVSFLDTSAPYVLVVGPDDADPPVPDVAEIRLLIEQTDGATVEPRAERPLEIDSLMAPPDQVPIVDEAVDPTFGYTTITYGNGATVFLWPSSIAENVVNVEIASFGGTSVVAAEDVPEAEMITGIVERSGIGPVDSATLQQLLADRLASVVPFISETREGLSGGAAAEDVEVLFQLVHLLMTAPRADEVAVAAVIDEMLTLDASRDEVPALATGDQLVDAYYSGDPRYFTVPSAQQLAEFDADRALAIYRERFANAGDFAFAFVGDFDTGEMRDLASRYIGTLPGSPEAERYVDNQPLPPREVQMRVVEAGTDPQGVLQMFFTNELDGALHDRLTARVLDLIVNARLRDRIREQLSATYSPQAGIDVQREPDPFVESFVEVTGDPERLDEIAAEVLADLDELRASGPTENEFATAVEQVRTEMELISNGELADTLITSALYPDQPATDLLTRYEVIEEVTLADVTDLARISFAPNQRIEIWQIPKS
jgi:zinc protease